MTYKETVSPDFSMGQSSGTRISGEVSVCAHNSDGPLASWKTGRDLRDML